MSLVKMVVSFGFLLCLASCASIHNDTMGSPEGAAQGEKSKAGLIVSGTENTTLAGEYFLNFEFTMENKTNKYVKVKQATLDFGSPDINKYTLIPTGQRLVAWANAAQQKKAIDDQNTQMILSSVAALGAVAVVSSSNTKVQGAGATALLGAAAVNTKNSVSNNIQLVEHAPLYRDGQTTANGVVELPADHLYAGAFEIPPDLFIKKWVTIQVEEPYKIPYISGVKLVLEYNDGTKESFVVKNRIPFANSAFQNDYVKKGMRTKTPIAADANMRTIKKQYSDANAELITDKGQTYISGPAVNL